MKLIQPKDYLLLTDGKAEIKEGDKFLADNVHIITCKGNSSKSFINNNFYRSKCAKIIAYYPLTKEAKELDLPLLPPFEEGASIKELALSLYNEPLNKQGEKRTQLVGHGGTPFGFNKWFKSFKVGYKAAQQSKQFSLEDIQKAISFGRGLEIVSLKESTKEVETTKFIQSLSTSQQLPKEFIPETYCYYGDDCPSKGAYDKQHLCDIRIKTITNSEGKQELVGKYIYHE